VWKDVCLSQKTLYARGFFLYAPGRTEVDKEKRATFPQRRTTRNFSTQLFHNEEQRATFPHNNGIQRTRSKE